MDRVSADDLAFAAEWLDAYDAAPGEDENGEKAARVSAWLRAEVARREKETAVRSIARKHGIAPAIVRRRIEMNVRT